jgi:hypothetical protein
MMFPLLHSCRLPFLATLATLALVSCASKEDLTLTDDPLVRPVEEQEPAYIPTYSTTVVKGWPKGRALDPRDVSRVRLGEEVHAYHLGRLPSNDRQEMHEAHTVYRVEQGAKWDTRLPATPMESRGVVLGIVEPSRAEVPHSEIIEQERQSLVAKSLEMQKAMARLTALQADLETKRRQFEETEKEAAQIKVYLEETRQKLAEKEDKLNKMTELNRQLQDNEKLRLQSSPQGFGSKKR